MTATKRNLRNLVTLGVFMGIVGTPLVTALADECKGNDPLNPTKQVCATWSDPGDPELQQHFTVDYGCTNCSDAPRVQFIRGGTSSVIEWVIYSEELDGNGDPTGPGNLGDVVLADDVDPDSGKFTVTIANGTSGAVNVSSIVLDTSDTNWTGHSSFTKAGSTTIITGNVTGDITVIQDGGGGEASGTTRIIGNVGGTLTIPNISGTFIIGGDLGDGDIAKISSGASLTMGGLFGTSPHELKITQELAGTVDITGGLNNHGVTIEVEDFEGYGRLYIRGFPTYPTINLRNGIDSADARVDIAYHGGQIYLFDNDVLGTLNFPFFGDGGSVVDGGALKGSVNCGSFSIPGEQTTPTNEGTIKFDSVAAGGEINADNIIAFKGLIHITTNMAGLIRIKHDLEERFPDAGGEVLIDGDLTGDVHIEGDIKSGAELTIGGALDNSGLTGGGRILVDGLCDGLIKIHDETDTLSLIHLLEGLDDNGRIEINVDRGNYSAGGDIQVGPTSLPADVVFDGCIHIYDNDEVYADHGDLNGDITIVGCHETDDNLDICIDGDINGTITIADGSCDPDVTTWSCTEGSCP